MEAEVEPAVTPSSGGLSKLSWKKGLIPLFLTIGIYVIFQVYPVNNQSTTVFFNTSQLIHNTASVASKNNSSNVAGLTSLIVTGNISDIIKNATLANIEKSGPSLGDVNRTSHDDHDVISGRDNNDVEADNVLLNPIANSTGKKTAIWLVNAGSLTSHLNTSWDNSTASHINPTDRSVTIKPVDVLNNQIKNRRSKLPVITTVAFSNVNLKSASAINTSHVDTMSSGVIETDGPPMFTFMNLTALNRTGTYTSPIPENLYYKKQERLVNRWTFPVIKHNPHLCDVTTGETRSTRAHNNQRFDVRPEVETDDINDTYSALNSSTPAGLFLSVFIFTAPGHRSQRELIRQTWGGLLSKLPQVTVTFVLGSSPVPSLQELILQEADQLGDIIVFDFIDHYENLTIKSMMTLSWANRFCGDVKYVLKTDDDVIFNAFSLLRSVARADREGWEMFGRDVGHRGVSRTGGWAEPESQFPYEQYPSYITGPAYCLSARAVRMLLYTSQYVPLLRLEDVYVTGLVRQTAGLQIENRNNWEMAHKMAVETDLLFVTGMIVGAHHYRSKQDKEMLYKFSLKFRKHLEIGGELKDEILKIENGVTDKTVE